jgi:hypothetical protein
MRTWVTNYYYYPDWTPDGRIICVKKSVTYREGATYPAWGSGVEVISTKYYITTMSDEGTQETDIKEIDGLGKVAASPLGNYIAYTEGWHINVINYSGSSLWSINCGGVVDSLDWSSTEAQIAYSTENKYSNWGTFESGGELIVVGKDGSHPVTVDHGFDPSWRARAELVYVDAYFAGSEWGWYPNKVSIINSGGTNKRSLESGREPQATKDGRIIYRGVSTPDVRVFDSVKAINFDGSEGKTLFYKSDLWNIRLSPDGQKIVGTGGGSGEDFGKEVWIINVDGTGLKQLR